MEDKPKTAWVHLSLLSVVRVIVWLFVIFVCVPALIGALLGRFTH